MALDKPLSPEQGWTEVTAPELVKWEKPGIMFAGVLTSVVVVDVKGKRVPEYTLTLGTQRFRFLGTYDIVQKLTPAHKGCQVRIKYLGEDETVTGGPNNQPMKRFSILTKGSPTTNDHGVAITDEDIPF